MTTKSKYLKLIPDRKDLWRNKKALIMGLGTSLKLFEPYKGLEDKYNLITIGVNDIGEFIKPDYLCVFDTPQSFESKRIKTILDMDDTMMITFYPGIWEKYGKSPHRIIEVGMAGNENWNHLDENAIPQGLTSTYMAACCAHIMGCKTIGLIGVDFTPNHYNNQDGEHNMSDRLKDINALYARLVRDLDQRGTKIYNLSPTSRIETVPSMILDVFMSL